MSTSDQTLHRAKKRKPVPIRLDVRPMGTSPRTEEFLESVYSQEGINSLGLPDFSPVHVYVYEEDGLLHLFVDIDDAITAEDLRLAAPLLVALRNRLFEFQGPKPTRHTKRQLFNDLCRLNENNSLPAVTAAVNEVIAELLAHFCDYLHQLSQAPPWNTPEEHITWLTEKPRYVYALSGAVVLLRNLSIPGIRTEAEIREFCSTALERIAKGEDPYLVVGQLLDQTNLRTHLREKLRAWKPGKFYNSLNRTSQT